eukprot:431854_1
MAQQSMLVNNNNKKINNKNIYGSDNNNNNNNNNNNIEITPFALYHLIYSHHNKQNDNISNFAGMSKSFSFEKLITKFGIIRTTVFYAANIGKDFEWLIRCVPGKNPPLEHDNLTQHIDNRSRYWDKKQNAKQNNNNNNIKILNNNSPQNFELVNNSPEQFGIKDFHLDAQIVNDNSITSNKSIKIFAYSPPIKPLSNNCNFHESPLLDTSTPKLDPVQEIEDIRRSIFDNAPPVLSIKDISSHYTNIHKRNNMNDSQLINSIIKQKQIISTRKNNNITLIQTLKDINNNNINNNNNNDEIFPNIEEKNENLNDSIVSSDINCQSDHDEMQDEIFKTYNDEKFNGNNVAE